MFVTVMVLVSSRSQRHEKRFHDWQINTHVPEIVNNNTNNETKKQIVSDKKNKSINKIIYYTHKTFLFPCSQIPKLSSHLST